jgi:thiol:disulfide interchange protein
LFFTETEFVSNIPLKKVKKRNFVLMRFRNNAFAFLLGLLFYGQLYSAGFPKPVFKASYSKNEAKAGETIELIIRLDIAKGFHVYSEKSDCPEYDGPLRAQLDFKRNATYELVGSFKGVGDHMVKEEEIWNCSTGEFTGKGEFRQKIRVLKSISQIQITFNGQICNESGCENLRDIVIQAPPLNVEGVTTALTVESPTEPTEAPVIIDTANTSSSNKTSNQAVLDYQKKEKLKEIKSFNGQLSNEKSEGIWGLFILAFLSGLTALLTPCVFPMIPMTVSFFIRNKQRAIALRDTFVFAFSIIALYTIVGTLVAFIFGANAANWLSTHWLPNIFFTVIFIVFAASFFGAFEITMPSWLVNKVDKQADKGGITGAIFMAITIALVSFSCTGPIVGTVLVEAVQGGAMRPAIAMFGFSLAFAIPFGLLALFPSWLNNLPKSGGWLNSVKVVLGFVELAFALKFLSIPDQTYHWGLLDREIYLAIWIVIFFLLGLYLMGKIQFDHDTPNPKIGVFRLGLIITVFTFVAYMIPGLFGAPLKALAGYLPPMSTQDFRLDRSAESKSGICGVPKYSEYLHSPHGINSYFDYDEAVACAREQKKPLFIDFTGHGCVNCRKMEEKVWADPKVLSLLKEKYVVVSLYVDDKKIPLAPEAYFQSKTHGKIIKTLGDKNADLQEYYFGKSTQPLYCLLNSKEELLQPAYGADYFQFKVEPFVKFLQEGLKEYAKNP